MELSEVKKQSVKREVVGVIEHRIFFKGQNFLISPKVYFLFTREW